MTTTKEVLTDQVNDPDSTADKQKNKSKQDESCAERYQKRQCKEAKKPEQHIVQHVSSPGCRRSQKVSRTNLT